MNSTFSDAHARIGMVPSRTFSHSAADFGTTATINTTRRTYVEPIPLLPAYPSAVPGAFSENALEFAIAYTFVRVMHITLWTIATDMLENAPLEDMLKLIPMQRVGTPEEVAALVAFLMSDEAAYITRQVIGVNGGLA